MHPPRLTYGACVGCVLGCKTDAQIIRYQNRHTLIVTCVYEAQASVALSVRMVETAAPVPSEGRHASNRGRRRCTWSTGPRDLCRNTETEEGGSDTTVWPFHVQGEPALHCPFSRISFSLPVDLQVLVQRYNGGVYAVSSNPQSRCPSQLQLSHSPSLSHDATYRISHTHCCSSIVTRLTRSLYANDTHL